MNLRRRRPGAWLEAALAERTAEAERLTAAVEELGAHLRDYAAAVIARDDEIVKLRAALDLANRDRDSQREARLRTLRELQELQQQQRTEEVR